jgi:hypothetical protein
MDNMNDETLNKLVVMLADEMTKRIYGISKQENRDDLVFYADEDEDHCLGELAAIKKHIDKINTILDKL